MLTYDLVVRARKAVVDGRIQQAAVAVRGGRIEEVFTGSEARAIEVAGDHNIDLDADVVLLPGLVDLGMSTGETGAAPAEAFVGLTRAAAAGGHTCVVDMPTRDEFQATSTAEFEARVWEAGGELAVDCGFWAAAAPATLGSLAEYSAAGALGFVARVGSGTGGELDVAGLRDALTEVAELDSVLCVRVVAGDAVGGAGGGVDLTREVLSAAGSAGCRIHLLHVADAEVLDDLRGAKADGHGVTAGTCPQHLVVSSEELEWMSDEVSPDGPVGDARNRERLWAALADGVLDSVSSRRGVSSVRYAASALWTGARMRGLSLTDVSRWTATAPARIAGLPGRGELRVGNTADLTVLDPGAAYVVTGQHPGLRSFGRPYCLERPLAGVVRTTILRGKIVDARSVQGRVVTKDFGGRDPAATATGEGTG